MVPEPIQEWFDTHALEHPELFHQNEKTLMELIRGLKGQRPHGIGITEHRIRVAFWMEFNRAMDANTNMAIPRVYGGICGTDYFNNEFMRKPEKVAWMLTPPVSYTIAMEESLVYGIEKLREVLDFPLYDRTTGKPDVRVGELILKVVQQMDLRVKGAVLQKSVNVHAHIGAPTGISAGESMTDLDARIKELEKQVDQTGLPPVIVVNDGE